MLTGAGLLAILAVVSAGCTSGSSATGAGHMQSVPSPVRNAVRSMQAAHDFTFAATVTTSNGKTHLSGQFEAPDREHIEFVAPNGTAREVVFVGTKAYEKGTDGAWRDAIGGSARPTDPRTAFTALLSAHFGAARASDYPCTMSSSGASSILSGSGGSGPITCKVTVEGAAIRELRLQSAHVNADVTYTDVGTTPPVPRP